MKHYLLFITLLGALVWSCEKTVLNTNDYEPIEGAIKDVTIDEGIEQYTINLEENFRIADSGNRLITHLVQTNSNPDLVTPVIEGPMLKLNVKVGQSGSSMITVRSEAGNVYKNTGFTFTVSTITAQQALDRAQAYFTAQDYDQAAGHFLLVTKKDDTDLLSEAYMGLGFSQMRSGAEDKEYGYNSFQVSLGYDAANNDARAGLNLLEYAYKRNYTEAIRYGRELLQRNNAYVFSYDPSIDHHDILVTIALSEYSSEQYTECLQTIQEVDPAFVLSAGDPEFEVKMFEKLEGLIATYR